MIFSALKRRPQNECERQMVELRSLLDKQTISTYQQAIVELRAETEPQGLQSAFAYEILNRPSASSLFIQPEKFYAFAASHGVVHEVDIAVLKTALERLFPPARRIPNGVNLSAEVPLPVYFLNVHLSTLFAPRWDDFLAEMATFPARFVLELSEREGLGNYQPEEVAQAMTSLQARGIQVAVDDLGMAYSGLYTLSLVRPNYVKIDRQLVARVDKDGYRQHMLEALVKYWRQEQVEVIAEGIERIEEIEFLREIGVQYAQGYWYHRPQLV